MLYHSITDEGQYQVIQDGEMIGLFNSYEAAEEYMNNWDENTQCYEYDGMQASYQDS